MTPTPDELRERGEAIVLELDYWQQVNGDVRRMVDRVADAAAAVAEATVAGVSLGLLSDSRALEFVSDSTDANGRAMRRLAELADDLEQLVGLVDGRLRVLGVAVDALAEAAS